MKKIPFNKPAITGQEEKYISQAIASNHLSGDGVFTKKCHHWFEEHLQCEKVLLTPSCTAALEMSAILIDIQPGDEVIMPSYTFVSTANAFVLRGAKIVFVDIRPDTMNIDEKLIEAAITSKTKAIVPVHYAGVACEMDSIMALAKKYNLFVVEDAAQAMMASYKGKPLGTIGHIGTYSFHETKNFTSGGEGGLLIINHCEFIERAEFIREKGTNRNKFFRGAVDRYTWVDVGSSYLPSELQAAYLWAQLNYSNIINNKRRELWDRYYQQLSCLLTNEKISFAKVPKYCEHNAHIFYLKLENEQVRQSLIEYLDCQGINSVFHYVPLHSSDAGMEFGYFSGHDQYTTSESEKLLRLPMNFSLTTEQVDFISNAILNYFNIK
ncbi:dTDP-4-amino-4,6-dideoxygalactose transaminase [Vibrio aestuarianus]|uniref:dTDP-4-amino-4,6-dideoxygalactose transaminase n=1 Tax=Vibrio aestuarianus TaxID=28171 RepID=UPI00237C6CA7|nr:dTDP-4-amino-4,6-dideoxygalactose transaminase [Vibrio aestuarianus]MDE1327134.1 dTDP-4-amino-4,6-dideoxygalactose transaminase [Vibrio aestuarianus]